MASSAARTAGGAAPHPPSPGSVQSFWMDLRPRLAARCVALRGWSEPYAASAVRAYAQFLHLKARLEDWGSDEDCGGGGGGDRGGRTVLVPPPAVREVWILHALDNRRVGGYASDCEAVLGSVAHLDVHGLAKDNAAATASSASPEEAADLERRIGTTRTAVKVLYGSDIDPEIWTFGGEEGGRVGGRSLPPEAVPARKRLQKAPPSPPVGGGRSSTERIPNTIQTQTETQPQTKRYRASSNQTGVFSTERAQRTLPTQAMRRAQTQTNRRDLAEQAPSNASRQPTQTQRSPTGKAFDRDHTSPTGAKSRLIKIHVKDWETAPDGAGTLISISKIHSITIGSLTTWYTKQKGLEETDGDSLVFFHHAIPLSRHETIAQADIQDGDTLEVRIDRGDLSVATLAMGGGSGAIEAISQIGGGDPVIAMPALASAEVEMAASMTEAEALASFEPLPM